MHPDRRRAGRAIRKRRRQHRNTMRALDQLGALFAALGASTAAAATSFGQVMRSFNPRGATETLTLYDETETHHAMP